MAGARGLLEPMNSWSPWLAGANYGRPWLEPMAGGSPWLAGSHGLLELIAGWISWFDTTTRCGSRGDGWITWLTNGSHGWVEPMAR